MLLNEAQTLEDDGRFYEALALIDRVLGMDADDRLVAAALTNKARVLAELDRTDQSLAACDEVIERFADQPDLVAYARYHRAASAFEHGRTAEALADVDQILRNDPRDEDDLIIADALLLKALVLRGEDGLALYDEVAERYLDDDAITATALAWKAELLGDLKRWDQGLTVARNVIARFDGATDSDVRLRVASAHVWVAGYLARKRQWAGAIEAYGRLLDGFDATESDEMATLVGWAREQRSALRVLHALRGPRVGAGVGVAALLIFTVFRRTGRRRDRERRRSVAVRLR